MAALLCQQLVAALVEARPKEAIHVPLTASVILPINIMFCINTLDQDSPLVQQGTAILSVLSYNTSSIGYINFGWFNKHECITQNVVSS